MEKYKNLHWCDLQTTADKIEFLKCGRAHETGIIVSSLVPEFVALLKDKLEDEIKIMIKCLKDM